MIFKARPAWPARNPGRGRSSETPPVYLQTSTVAPSASCNPVAERGYRAGSPRACEATRPWATFVTRRGRARASIPFARRPSPFKRRAPASPASAAIPPPAARRRYLSWAALAPAESHRSNHPGSAWRDQSSTTRPPASHQHVTGRHGPTGSGSGENPGARPIKVVRNQRSCCSATTRVRHRAGWRAAAAFFPQRRGRKRPARDYQLVAASHLSPVTSTSWDANIEPP